MRANANDILIFTMVRQVLVTVASMVSNIQDTSELERFRKTLIAEVEAIKPGGDLSEIWIQASTAMVEEYKDPTLSGLRAYALQRLGVFKSKE